jgi:hypothetical protein
MNQGFIAILQQLISEQGKEALLNPAKCKAYLADYTHGEYKKESRLLLQALEAGVQKAIDATKELEICKQQQVSLLREEHFLAIEVAADVVDTLALVLREGQENEVSRGAVCSNCGKELQKEWGLCPYCGMPTAKIQQSPQLTEPQPIPSSEPVVEVPSPEPTVPSSSPAPVRIDSILPRSIFYKIPFCIETPRQGMDVTLKESNGICNRNPGDSLSTKEKNKFSVYANKKKAERVRIILKCKPNSADTLFAFKLVFQDKHLKRYSKAIALEMYES